MNAALGVAATLIDDGQVRDSIIELQQELFSAGWDLATPLTSDVPRLTARHTLRLENEIDLYETELPPLKNFILPGGSPGAAALHLARCVCRRAERRLVTLMHHEEINGELERYINRVSDYLFVIARVAAHRAGVSETTWTRS